MKKLIVLSILCLAMISCVSYNEGNGINDLSNTSWRNEVTGDCITFTNILKSDETYQFNQTRGYIINGISDASNYYANSRNCFSKGTVYFTYYDSQYEDGEVYDYGIFQYMNRFEVSINLPAAHRFKVMGNILYIEYSKLSFDGNIIFGWYKCDKIK